ncbi:MAG: glycosyltransferase family 2 protein [Planctomycetia bacterium]|nr:glycosyltransferase family 2 protein [Planctomycetia bacterium]
MLTDWLHWLTTLRFDELAVILGVLLFVDSTRYVYGTLCMAAVDVVRGLSNWLRGVRPATEYSQCPTVCVLLVGHNEGDTIADALESMWGRYPRLELIVVSDGSTDGMVEIAQQFAAEHAGVLVLSREERGGKSSALNWGLRYTRAEIVVCMDCDSRFSDNALWEIVQPFADPQVGAVSATVEAWNAFHNLCTWLQAYEYRQTIFMGRQMADRFNTLAIVSGAFGAFRRELLERIGGWDVGPGEDGDVTLRIRRLGYRIAAAPQASCLTKVPTEWDRLFQQRRRWDRSVVTYECRKHFDMAYFWQRHFRWNNFVLFFERWFFNIYCLAHWWLYGMWLLWIFTGNAGNVLVLLYLCLLTMELVQTLLLLGYSHSPGRDLRVSLILPFYPLYQAFLKTADAVAVIEELFFRRSKQDNFVPAKVRDKTWHW